MHIGPQKRYGIGTPVLGSTSDPCINHWLLWHSSKVLSQQEHLSVFPSSMRCCSVSAARSHCLRIFASSSSPVDTETARKCFLTSISFASSVSQAAVAARSEER